MSIQLGATFATFTVTNPSLALERPVNLGSLGLSKLWEAKGRGKEINWIQPPPLQTFTFHLPPQPSPPKRKPQFLRVRRHPWRTSQSTHALTSPRASLWWSSHSVLRFARRCSSLAATLAPMKIWRSSSWSLRSTRMTSAPSPPSCVISSWRYTVPMSLKSSHAGSEMHLSGLAAPLKEKDF